ncbi:hypothetical protein BKA66DRAFT_456139 [Pyrenochaeta sp. MPI-SDFR-AT-0127]|nr:hypothetical protein BKA66DRAFT_456139 [Pyrenochaeta sp. MPI-SDFR-AT-0127]
MLPSFTSTKPKHANHSHSKTSSSMNSIGRVSTHDLDSNIMRRLYVLDVNHGSPVKDPTAKVVKIKRSFRNIFQKRDVERAGTKPMMVDTKQAFMMGTRSSLAKCIRNSTALSKVHLSKMSESKTELELRSECQVETINANHRVVQSSPEAASFDTSQQPSYAPRYDPATVVNNILDHVTSMSTDASDRLSGLEIAEAVLHSVECYREAKVSTEKARKHARDAELHADRAGMALIQLQKLCEPILDGQTLLAIKELVQQAGLVDSKKALESGVHEQ